MGIETTIYTPRTLGKLVRRMPPVHTFFRDTFFKNRRTFNTKSVDVDFKKGSRALAPFVHPKVGGKTILNTGYQTKSYTPVLLAPNKITTVDDLLERAAGEDPYSGRKPAERAVEKLAEDLRELNEMIVRREEWMAATAIFTGQIPIVGEGVNEVIDFDFTNKETIVSAEKKWDNAQSDPLADIERWHEIVQREGFVNCNVCVMAKDVATAFINHAKVKEVLDVKAYDLAVIKPRQLPNGATYIGTYTQEGGAISDDVISENVNAAVGAFKKWQAEKMGRDVNPSYLIQLLMQAGVKRVEVRAPVFATVKDNQVAKIGTTTVTNGGAESE